MAACKVGETVAQDILESCAYSWFVMRLQFESFAAVVRFEVELVFDLTA